MSNYNKRTKQDDDDFFENMSEENRELLKRAFLEVAKLEIRMIDEAFKDIEIPPPSKR